MLFQTTLVSILLLSNFLRFRCGSDDCEGLSWQVNGVNGGVGGRSLPLAFGSALVGVSFKDSLAFSSERILFNLSTSFSSFVNSSHLLDLVVYFPSEELFDGVGRREIKIVHFDRVQKFNNCRKPLIQQSSS